MKSAELKYEDISIGNIYEFERKINRNDVLSFAHLTGDQNPLHVNPEFGKKSQFGQNLVHGLLAASLFSRLIGMYCPGQNSLYLSQTLQFKGPIFIEDLVTVRATVTHKSDSIKVIDIKTEVIKKGMALITGLAKVQVIE